MSTNELRTRAALAAFRNGDYEQALCIYRDLSSWMGSSYYEANIQICLRRLASADVASLDSASISHSGSSNCQVTKTIDKQAQGGTIEEILEQAQTLRESGKKTEEFELLDNAARHDSSLRVLKAAFWAACRAGKFDRADELLEQIEIALLQSDYDLAWLQKARDSKLRRQRITLSVHQLEGLLMARSPRAFEPVPKRICYVLHNSLPYSSGGYATRAHGMAIGLRSAGMEPICITRPGFPIDLSGFSSQDIPSEQIIDGIPYHRITSPDRKSLKGLQYILESASTMQSKLRLLRPQIVMAASNHITALPVLIAAYRLGIPFIYEVRGFWEVTRISREPEFQNTDTYAELVALETLAAKKANHVFTLTEPMREELIDRGVCGANITLLPNSVDPDQFRPRPRDQELAARLGIPAGVPVIGYIGSFVQYEGLEHLAQACAILARRGLDFRLLLVGNENVSGNDRGPIATEILRIANQEGLADKLIMPGRIPHEQVAAYYSLIDIAPFPRKPQPVTEMVSPMKPLEAFAMAKAVVVSSVCALTEMVEHEKTGLVFEKGNMESLANTLERLLADAGLREQLAEAGKQWVESERTWRKTAEKGLASLKDSALIGRILP